jgi:energy-coupling factor transporter ATP-binding protein EcfA2
MNSKEALNFINRLLQEKEKPVLNENEEKIFLGCWEGTSYTDIAGQGNLYPQYARELGGKLFTKIKAELGIIVSKRNFVNQIEYSYKKYSSQAAQEQLEEPKKLPEPRVETNHNPFIPQSGGIDNSQQFFYRGQTISRIFEILNSGSSVALIGEEGIGKSSLLHAICQLAENQLIVPRQPIFLDLNEIDDEEDFYCALCSEADIPESTGYQLKRYLKQRSEKLLLALDNVGQMTSEGFTRQVRDRLRGLAEGSNAPLKLILAANVSLNILFDDSQEGGKISPLAGICLEETIEPWDETTIRNFIEARLARTAVRFTEAEISQLVQESGGHPRRLMQGCYRIYAQYKQPGQ